MERRFNDQLLQHVEEHVLPALSKIPEERKPALRSIAEFVKEQQTGNGSFAHLTFICTHNSRRSHFGQIWAAAAAWYHELDHVRTYSGGTEATAFHPNAVAALERAGFSIEDPGGSNARYTVSFTPGIRPLECWSKIFDDPSNPREGYCAVMVCDHADMNCPNVSGATARISLPYYDPKQADGTPQEAETYTGRSIQIAAEMFFVMQLAAR